MESLESLESLDKWVKVGDNKKILACRKENG